MINKKKYRKTALKLITKLLCILIVIELVLVNFGFCGHSHDQWNDLHQIRENSTNSTTTFKTSDLHNQTKDDHTSHQNNQSHCNFRCPCNGGITGVLHNNALRIIAAQNQFFHYKPQLREFSLIPSIFHPPLSTR